MSWLTDPIMHYGFFRAGLLAGVLGGRLCGLVGVYVVLRKMSYIGHGLSHAIFGGAAVAYVLGWNFYLGAGAWGVLSALLINGVARRRKVGADAAIGVVTTASFAVGVVLITSVHSFTVNLEAALFGNILGVTAQQLWVLAGVGIVTLALILLRYRQLLFATFDPEAADAYGVSSRAADALFAIIIAATVVATMQILGVTLDRRHHRGARGDRPAPHGFLRPDAGDLHADRRGLRGAGHVRVVLRGHPARGGHRADPRGRVRARVRGDGAPRPSPAPGARHGGLARRGGRDSSTSTNRRRPRSPRSGR